MPTIDPSHTTLLRHLQTGGELPLHALFAQLAQLWHARNPEARSKDLACWYAPTVAEPVVGQRPRQAPALERDRAAVRAVQARS